MTDPASAAISVPQDSWVCPSPHYVWHYVLPSLLNTQLYLLCVALAQLPSLCCTQYHYLLCYAQTYNLLLLMLPLYSLSVFLNFFAHLLSRVLTFRGGCCRRKFSDILIFNSSCSEVRQLFWS